MAVVDTLTTRYILHNQQYVTAAQGVTNATAGIATSMAAAGPKIAAIGAALAGIVAPAAAAGASLLAAARIGAEFEAQEKALSLYATAGNSVTDMLKDLREVAKLPGLGNLEAIQGAVQFMAGGFSFDEAVASMMAFGNALASAGRGKEDLFEVSRQLVQISSLGKVTAENINVIAERVPQVRRAMLDAFGTANSEALQKMGVDAKTFIAGVVAQLALLPAAVSGAKNEMDNFGDATQRAFGDAGKQLNRELLPLLRQVSGFFDADIFSGIGATWGAALADLFGGNGNGRPPLVMGLAMVAASLETMPTIARAAFDVIITAVAEVYRNLAELFNMIRSVSPWLMTMMPEMDPNNLFKMPKGGFDPLGARGLFEANLESILVRYDLAQKRPNTAGVLAEFPMPEGAGGKDPGLIELEQQTETLRAIERNTSPTNARILGGGNLGAIGVTPVELSGMGGRGGKMNQLVDLLQGLVREEAAVVAAGMITRAGRLSGF